jgi:transposase
MWTSKNRARYERSQLPYPSDLTDEEWAHVEPLIPPAKRGGNKRTVNLREVVNGLMYVLSTGCQWRAIPKDLPPRSTVRDYFDLWSGTERSIASMTRFTSSAASNRSARQARLLRLSIARASRARKKGACDRPFRLRRGQEDQGQEAPHPRRHTRPFDACDRSRSWRARPRRRCAGDGEPLRRVPIPGKLYADGGYQGPEFRRAVKKVLARIHVEIVKRLDCAKEFVVLPKRWIVERTFAWLGRCRRLAKDWENLNRKGLAFLRLASHASKAMQSNVILPDRLLEGKTLSQSSPTIGGGGLQGILLLVRRVDAVLCLQRARQGYRCNRVPHSFVRR